MVVPTIVLNTIIAIACMSAISALAALFYPRRAAKLRSLMVLFVGIAVGALLGDAFIHLIPEASEALGAHATALWVLAGMALFFVLEKFLHWHHHHETHEVHAEGHQHACVDCDEHVRPFGFLIVVSDVLHNMIDGIIIAAGFLISPEAGIATAIAVALHELPQEIGDFGVLLHAGFSRTGALVANVASSFSAFLGAALVFIVGTNIEASIPIFSALAAGSFIYIATADLVPELHRHVAIRESLVQLAAVVLGVLIMFSLTFAEAPHADEGHETTTAHTDAAMESPAETSSPAHEAAARLGTERVRRYIERVVDGDTIVVNDGHYIETVRLLGIDAPETNSATGKAPECYASEATQALRTLLPVGTAVLLETDPSQDTYDQYGRLLAYVYVAETPQRSVNETLVASGAAHEYTFKGRAYAQQSELRGAQEHASEQSLGLWALCY